MSEHAFDIQDPETPFTREFKQLRADFDAADRVQVLIDELSALVESSDATIGDIRVWVDQEHRRIATVALGLCESIASSETPGD
jgi:hypothetical protein